MTYNDTDTMTKDHGDQPSTGGRINFGVRRIKKLKSFMHWTQDLRRISEFLIIKGISGVAFLAQMDRTNDRSRIPKKCQDDYDTNEKGESPIPLK